MDSSLIGPVIGGIIAAAVGFVFTIWIDERQKRSHQKIVEKALKMELTKYERFIDYIQQETGFFTKLVITHQSEISLLTRKIRDNPFFKIDVDSPFLSKKSAFEIFYQDIYKFNNEYLINVLLDFYRAIYDADMNLRGFFTATNESEMKHNLSQFLNNLKRADDCIFTIRNEGWLDFKFF